jgi:putative transposase
MRGFDRPEGRGDFQVKKRKRHSPEEIIAKLRDAELAEGRGEPLESILQRLEVSEQTFYRWRNQYGGMKAPNAKHLKELDQENARLNKLVADQALDIDMLKKVARGNF